MIGQYGTASRQMIAFGMMNLAAFMMATSLVSTPNHTTTVLVARNNIMAGSIITEETSYNNFQEVILLANNETDTSKFIHNREELKKKINGRGRIIDSMAEGDYMLDTNITEQ